MYRFIIGLCFLSFATHVCAETYLFHRERPARSNYRKPAYSKPARREREPDWRAYRHTDRDDKPRGGYCDDKVRGVGTQWIGTKGAMDAAWKDWMERVRYDLGESFLDRTHAVDVESRCGRVSVGEVAGQVLYRCEIVARPCKASFAETSIEAESNTEK
jgi:hypothetical protein